MIRLLLVRVPRRLGMEASEAGNSALQALSRFSGPLDIHFAPSNSTARQLAEAIALKRNSEAHSDPLIDDFDGGRRTADFNTGAVRGACAETSESEGTFLLRVRLWVRRMEDSAHVERSMVVFAGGGTLEMLALTLLGLGPDRFDHLIVAHDAFHAHIWTGDVFDDVRFKWCLRASNVNPKHLGEADLPLRHLLLVRPETP